MINLNDTLYDDKPYSTRSGERDNSSYIVSDKLLLDKLQSYELFEKGIVAQINEHVKYIYLRFCDGEFIYYTNPSIFDFFKKIVKKILGKRMVTSWGEVMENDLQPFHWDYFRNYSSITTYCPMCSDARIYSLRRSKLYDILNKQELIGHLYYVYHFLNKLRQGLIPELIGKKICYVTHNQYIEQFDHIQIGKSYNDESINKLEQYDFSSYDIILLGGGISSPLYSKAIAKTAKCPIIDSGYMLSIWNSKEKYNEGPFTHLLNSL